MEKLNIYLSINYFVLFYIYYSASCVQILFGNVFVGKL